MKKGFDQKKNEILGPNLAEKSALAVVKIWYVILMKKFNLHKNEQYIFKILLTT